MNANDSFRLVRDGRIIWIGVSDEAFIRKPWPRFVRDENRVV